MKRRAGLFAQLLDRSDAQSERSGETGKQKYVHLCGIIGYGQEIALELGFWDRKAHRVKKRETKRRLSH
jgi:hypothetical protein